MSTLWTPHLTVAAIIEQDNRFLMVEEHAEGGVVLNQPAGHVEEQESIRAAAIRETLEETGRRFHPEAITGLYRWRSPHNQVTYLRVCFHGSCGERDHDFALDSDIITTHWLTYDELVARETQLRSPLVLRCIRDYLNGKQLPLDLFNELA
jgi:8-oxo-dGTP pyrophosphatase MutT (NUDIX family)